MAGVSTAHFCCRYPSLHFPSPQFSSASAARLLYSSFLGSHSPRSFSSHSSFGSATICSLMSSSYTIASQSISFEGNSRLLYHAKLDSPFLLRILRCSDNLGKRLQCTSTKLADGDTVMEGAVSSPKGEQDDMSSFYLPVGAFRKRLRIVDIKGGPTDGLERVGEQITVRGWIRTCRLQKAFTFLEVNDGSCLSNLQCVVGSDVEGYSNIESGAVTTGASVAVEGILVESQGSKQKIELKATKLHLIGGSDATTYPVQKKKLGREFLRSVAHMRPRTNTFGAVSRIRNALAFATHKFFQERGFIWVASPIITASDCEGAGEQFCVTTLIPSSHQDSTTQVGGIPSTKDGLLDWSQDFFGRPAFLTVSGQLNAETYATALSDVYTFGPTFRAENSNTSRHLAEFWMIEPEIAFADLKDDMACAASYLQYVVQHVLDNCKEDMEFFNTWVEKGIIARLQDVAEKNFIHITYTDAVNLLLKAKRKFEYPVKWGCDLQSEHERYITEKVFNGTPVLVTDYPKDIKAFYMRQNDDGKTVAAMDLLVPRVGELIGGSQREERLEVLERRIEELGLEKKNYWWYLDLRRYGTVPHAGFGLGFERLVQFATGIENIRDAIPFPRAPGSAEF